MSWSWTLYRYLAEQFLSGVAIVYSVFLLLAFSIDVVDLTNRTAGHGVSTFVVVGMAILQLPDLGQKMLPFAVLLGGVFAFARLSRSQELVAIRAAGMSANGCSEWCDFNITDATASARSGGWRQADGRWN